jgi:tetratricopeptide (TPR) repeat protein
MAMIYFDDAKNDEARAYYNREQTIAREVGDDLGYARATVNIAVIEKNEKNYNASVRLGLEALGVFKQQGNSLGITTAANVLANAYVALNNYPDAVAYARQNLDASLQLRELRGVSSACGTLSNIYADKGDNAEMAFSSLCAATLIKQLKINNLPHSGEDYGIFVSRLRRLVTGDRNYPATIAAAEKRVQDIFISLNLGTELIRNEVAALQASTIPLDRSAPSLAGK